MTFRLIHADCLEAMAAMDPSSVDAIVTDPPYGLEFMGKEWDRLGDIGQTSHPGPKADGFKSKGISYSGSSNRKCGRCGKWEWDHIGRKCECADPIWPNIAAHQGRIMGDWHHAWATQALRVLKPGGHLLAFGGTRTYHRLACAVEDAGFEIRDCLAWMYGSGFPKSLDVSKAIDARSMTGKTNSHALKTANAQRPDGGVNPYAARANKTGTAKGRARAIEAGYKTEATEPTGDQPRLTVPATPDAERWQGWGTALKPAFEPIVLARKPLSERNVAANVQRWGTGALNVDGCRIEAEPGADFTRPEVNNGKHEGYQRPWMDDPEAIARRRVSRDQAEDKAANMGRWPPNVTMDPEAAAMLDAQTGELWGQRRNVTEFEGKQPSGMFARPTKATHAYDDPTPGASRFFKVVQQDAEQCPTCGATAKADNLLGVHESSDPLSAGEPEFCSDLWHTTVGQASRFFYIAKAAREERNRGLGHLNVVPTHRYGAGIGEGLDPDAPAMDRNHHPTVKPVELMQWLCRMVTPPRGTILDPFTGSGTTGMAALREGFEFTGIEREPEYVEIARARIIGDGPLFNVEAGVNRKQATAKADRLFSLHVRSVGYCELAELFPAIRCNGNLQCCHVISRRYKAVRWDRRNALCGCAAHHLYGTHHPLEWEEAARKNGVDWDTLRITALNYSPMDPFAVIEELEEA